MTPEQELHKERANMMLALFLTSEEQTKYSHDMEEDVQKYILDFGEKHTQKIHSFTIIMTLVALLAKICAVFGPEYLELATQSLPVAYTTIREAELSK